MVFLSFPGLCCPAQPEGTEENFQRQEGDAQEVGRITRKANYSFWYISFEFPEGLEQTSFPSVSVQINSEALLLFCGEATDLVQRISALSLILFLYSVLVWARYFNLSFISVKCR